MRRHEAFDGCDAATWSSREKWIVGERGRNGSHREQCYCLHKQSMQFEHDLLISYAHIDDQALVEGENGWVARFHRLLEIRVGQLLGQTPKIWRDLKLQGNDYFADTILDRLPRI